MLVLERKIGERIRLTCDNGDEVFITVTEVHHAIAGSKVKIGIEAPTHIKILREEIINKVPKDYDEITKDRTYHAR